RYEAQLDADAKDFIEFAVDGATRMNTLIKNLLDYSRIGTRGNPFTVVDTNMLLENVCTLVSAKSSKKISPVV
ncbi:MAG: hypothetical protein GY755_22405, partial [Chloroflexi bacterium]|nr:hypothetical protein [Chloroflexota bacterium]